VTASGGNISATGNSMYAGLYYDYNNTAFYSWPGQNSNLNGIYCNGIVCYGSVSKASGSFRIPHPLPALAPTKQLVHSFIEGPYCDLLYRGTVDLIAGTATLDIDETIGMTSGTFVALCKNTQIFLTNQTDWTLVKGSISGSTLTIIAQDPTSTATISWMVVGERHDPHIISTNWTDLNGRPILEPLNPTS